MREPVGLPLMVKCEVIMLIARVRSLLMLVKSTWIVADDFQKIEFKSSLPVEPMTGWGLWSINEQALKFRFN